MSKSLPTPFPSLLPNNVNYEIREIKGYLFMQMSPIVTVSDLKKTYGAVEALKGITFEIEKGEVFGLLGPNGAGKTTTVEILEGLRGHDGGFVQVLGLDPFKESLKLKDRIGACLQFTNLPERIKVIEALELYASFYTKRADPNKILSQVDLEAKKSAYYSQLSGGQKQRLALALALINDPELFFLDEPTAGLDPQVRRGIHELIRRLKGEGKTILLTTHYIEEAERLCDRVAIIDNGQIIALGSPRELVARSEGTVLIEVRCEQPVDLGSLYRLDQVASASVADTTYFIRSLNAAQTIVSLSKFLGDTQNVLVDLHITRPSLEDVFVQLTGRRMKE